MHVRLASVAADLWGVDIDSDGIAFLRQQGFPNVFVGDASALDKLEDLRGQDFDVVVASEVLEHLANPGLFLDAVKCVMIPDQTRLIVTVPNAFRIRTLLWMLRRIELVHPDHNFWFSYLTATNLLRKSGFKIESINVYYLRSYHILPRSLRHPFRPKAIEGSGSQGPLVNGARVRGVRRPSRIRSYLTSLPERLLASILYRHNPFWADGLILVASIPDHT